MDDHKHVTDVYCCIKIYPSQGLDNYVLSLTSYPRGVELVWPEPPSGQVLAGDALLVLGVVTNTRVGEQAD